MEEQKKVMAAALVIIVIIGIAGAIYYFGVMKRHQAGPGQPTEPAAVKPESADTSGGKFPPGETIALPPVALDESDPVVRGHAGSLSADGLFAQWIRTKNLIRTFVVVVDNIATGQNPRSHIDFFEPSGKFKVLLKKGAAVIDEKSYARYDPVAEVAASMDAHAAAVLYRSVKPLIQEAYKDLGYPGTDFDGTLVEAISRLLETPDIAGTVRVEKGVLSYKMTDETLEGLSPAQKQLLRMGPKNVRAIQANLREFAAALGVAESRLPQTPVYGAPGPQH